MRQKNNIWVINETEQIDETKLVSIQKIDETDGTDEIDETKKHQFGIQMRQMRQKSKVWKINDTDETDETRMSCSQMRQRVKS